jgi:hypothetical protein
MKRGVCQCGVEMASVLTQCIEQLEFCFHKRYYDSFERIESTLSIRSHPLLRQRDRMRVRRFNESGLLCILRATLDEGLWSRVQWNGAILLAESHKIGSTDECPRPKSGKSRLNLQWHHFGGKINWFRPKKKELQRRAHDLENQDVS